MCSRFGCCPSRSFPSRHVRRSAAVLGRGGPGLVFPVYARTVGAFTDMAHSWGMVTGPAVVEALWIGVNGGGPGARTVPMAFPEPIGHVEGADLTGLLLRGIPLLPSAGVAGPFGGWLHDFMLNQWGRFWPRKEIPWPRWSPGFVTLSVPGGPETSVIFSVRFPRFGNPGGREVAGGY